MLFTFLVEVALAIYLLLRYRGTLFTWLTFSLLLCLASFQLAEFQVCEGPACYALNWTRLGLVGITLLPALGLHLTALLVPIRQVFVWLGYAVAATYSALFLFSFTSTGSAVCAGNYVLLSIKDGTTSYLYHTYYMVFLIIPVWALLMRLTKDLTPAGLWMLFGYFSFTLPMAVVGGLYPELRIATPSFLCGFALLLALIVTLKVVPLHLGKKGRKPIRKRLLKVLRA
jgi:hypothetical protein